MSEYNQSGFYGGAISAEEFAASLGLEERSGSCLQQQEEATDRPCGRPGGHKVCCFEVEPCPGPRPPVVEESCCCKEAFRAALGLLCDPALSELLDFEATAFFTPHYGAGAAVTESVPTDTPADNLAADPAGAFLRMSLCSRDLLDIRAPLYTMPDTATGLTAAQVSLCQLTGVVVQLAEAAAEGDLSPEEVAARNFRLLKRLLTQRISPCGCEMSSPSCPCGREDCCCADGLLAALSERNLSRRVSLAAGPLLLSGVTLLGRVGHVLVLANDADQRIYFVCVNGVEFLV